jgi:hypothetical protein
MYFHLQTILDIRTVFKNTFKADDYRDILRLPTSNLFSMLKMEAENCSEILAVMYRTTWEDF